MQIFNKETRIDFLGKRFIGFVISLILIAASVGAIAIKGLNFGIDFTGGTLVEVGYHEAVEIDAVRSTLAQGGFDQAIVQHFGTAKDVLVRLPSTVDGNAATLSADVMKVLREANNEALAGAVEGQSGAQQCVSGNVVQNCQVQMRRVEFVGPQVGEELVNQGGLAMLYALGLILIYVSVRFRWQFAVGSVVALVHDVIITVGAFALFQFEFSLPVLAAVLAVIGYSLNDTIVVFDRIRENFRKLRKVDSQAVMNISVNQTLPRTILTSVTTLMVVLALLILGGEVIRGFAIALSIGVLIGTYSSIFVASPSVLSLGIQREHMLQPETTAEDDTKAVV